MSGTESNRRPPAVQSAKITDTHRSKLAVVYVRQSTPQQVAENPESLARQYALADHARALGWPAERPPSSMRISGKAVAMPIPGSDSSACWPRSAWTMSGWSWAWR
jgi:hypothetical protein